MRYLGGKSRIAKQLAAVIDKHREPGQLVWDAFCGSLAVSRELSKTGPVLSTDSNQALVSLHLAVRDGWDPPKTVSEEEYHSAKLLPDTDPLKAFCGFGCSFSGKWFGGYARSGDRNYAQNCRNSLLKHRYQSDVRCQDFLLTEPFDNGCILYCDPPYRGTTGYDGVGSFSHDLFEQRVLQWSNFVDVFVSEYNFPVGACIWEREQSTTVSRNKAKYSKATERLFYIPKGSVK